MSSETNAIFFAGLLTKLNLCGEGAEIGVFRGDFSIPLLTNWNCHRLHLIDPWNLSKSRKGKHGTAAEYASTQQRVRDSGMAGRVQFHKQRSSDAVATFRDNSLDFVYIDGDHAYDAVFADLRYWWPKLRNGGVFAGHDYRFDCGVPAALWQFTQDRQLHYVVTAEHAAPNPNSFWYLIKP